MRKAISVMLVWIMLSVYPIYGFETIEAQSHMTKNCDKGNVEQCQMLADMYQEEVFTLTKSLCEQNYLTNCLTLGQLYTHGFGVAKNFSQAFDAYLKGCQSSKQVCEFSNNRLSLSARDLVRIVEQLKKSCDEGENYECFQWRIALHHGYGMHANKQQAFRDFLTNCEVDGEFSCVEMGHLYLDRQLSAHNLALDYVADAWQFYGKACQNNNAEGCYYFVLNQPSHNKSSNLSLYKKSCKGGYGSACLILGATYLGNHNSELNVIVNIQQAKEYFQQACNASQGKDCLGVEYMARTDNHHQVDEETYRDFLQELCWTQKVEGFCDYIWNVEQLESVE